MLCCNSNVKPKMFSLEGLQVHPQSSSTPPLPQWEIFGGPASTAAMRPLEHVAIIYGFQSQREAMRVSLFFLNAFDSLISCSGTKVRGFREPPHLGSEVGCAGLPGGFDQESTWINLQILSILLNPMTVLLRICLNVCCYIEHCRLFCCPRLRVVSDSLQTFYFKALLPALELVCASSGLRHPFVGQSLYY